MIDFASLWDQTIRENSSARHIEAVDVAFWERTAQANAKWTRRTPRTLEALRCFLKGSESLLEVGAGTGRFALQLAPFVEQVTALDYSEAMLAQLEKKRASLGVHNVTSTLGNLATATLEPHDTVLAAWSLYSSADILSTLKRLLDLSQKRLIIVDDDSSGSPHRQLQRQLQRKLQGQGEPPRPVPMPKYLVLTGALWQLGVRADIRIIREINIMIFESREAFLGELCPEDVNETEQRTFFEQLSPYISLTSHGLRYAYPFEVALIHWQRPGEIGAE